MDHPPAPRDDRDPAVSNPNSGTDAADASWASESDRTPSAAPLEALASSPTSLEPRGAPTPAEPSPTSWEASGPTTAPWDAPSSSAFPSGFQSLSPRIRLAWTLSGLLRFFVLTGLAVAVDWMWLKEPQRVVPQGVISLVVAGFTGFGALVLPSLRYRAWRYAFRAHDVLLHFGVLFRTQRSVPRLRIQHVDIHSGPIERGFGLCSLTLFTAGTGEADAHIPGLTPLAAEALREQLLAEDWTHE